MVERIADVLNKGVAVDSNTERDVTQIQVLLQIGLSISLNQHLQGQPEPGGLIFSELI